MSPVGLRCLHSATNDADFLADDVALKSLEPRMVCSRYGLIGADVRPNWSDQPERETMVDTNFDAEALGRRVSGPTIQSCARAIPIAWPGSATPAAIKGPQYWPRVVSPTLHGREP